MTEGGYTKYVRAELREPEHVPNMIDDILGKKRDELCQACFKRPRTVEDEDLCEYCDNFTHIRDKLGVIVASYDDYGHRMNLR